MDFVKANLESKKKTLGLEKADYNTVIRESCDIWKLLNEFQNSGLECARVTGWAQKSAASCQASISHATKRYHISHIKAKHVKGEVYLINTLLIKK